jgi:hypothetical protein
MLENLKVGNVIETMLKVGHGSYVQTTGEVQLKENNEVWICHVSTNHNSRYVVEGKYTLDGHSLIDEDSKILSIKITDKKPEELHFNLE